MKKLFPLLSFLIFLFLAIYSKSQSPSFDWGFSINTTDDNYHNNCRLTIDNSNNSILAGVFVDTIDCDPSANIAQETSSNYWRSYITKYDSTGIYQWSLSYGEETNTVDVETDQNNNIYVLGDYYGTVDFNPGPSSTSLTSLGYNDIYVIKFDSSGNFLWAKSFGTVSRDLASDIEIDKYGDVYVCGASSSLYLFEPVKSYCFKIDSNGNTLWSKTFGVNYSNSTCLSIDNNMNLVVGGSFGDTVSFDTASSPNFTLGSAGGMYDGYFMGIDSQTGQTEWVKQLGGPDNQYVSDIEINNSEIVVTGYFKDTCDFDPSSNTYNLSVSGANNLSNLFLLKTDSIGNFEWVKRIETPGPSLFSLAVDSFSNIFYKGRFYNQLDLDPGPSSYIVNSNGSQDFFSLKLNKSGDFEWGIRLGGSYAEKANYDLKVKNQSVFLSLGFKDTIDLNPFSGTSISGVTNLNKISYGLIKLHDPCSTTDTIDVTFCSGTYTVPSGDTAYSQSGIYLDTIPNSIGCDSLITINLNILNSNDSLNISTCNSYTVPSGDETYTTSGTYMDTIPNSSSCDSIITINLTVNTPSSSSINETSCESYTVPSGDESYTTSGTYFDTIPNSNGCDSVISINLTINHSSSDSITVIRCDSFHTPSGKPLTSSGVFKDTISNSVGCDSIITIDLTLNNSFDTLDISTCDSYTTQYSGVTHFNSGTYFDTTTNSIGCDSIITINLSILNSFDSLEISSCNSYTAPSGDETYINSGIFMDTILNSNNCDSILLIDLTINDSTSSTIYETICDSYTVPSGDETYTTSGTYMDTIPNSKGCDSILTIDLTINHTSYSSINATSCDSFLTPSGQSKFTSGIFNDTITNSTGCDSIITVNLTILNSSIDTIDVNVCEYYTLPSGNNTYTQSGNYYDTIPNIVGCDSILFIRLNIQNSSNNISVTACDSFTVPSGNETYTSSGVYPDTILNSVGCDSILTINLTINQSSYNSITVTSCDSFLSPAGQSLHSSGTYHDTLINSVGCDSVISINLTIFNSSFDTLNVATCNSYTIPSGNSTYTQSGTYNDTVPNAEGCDSILTINLTIQNNSSNITVTSCDNYTVPSGDETYTYSGIYMDTVQNSFGCDSVLTIDLVIEHSTTGVITEQVCNSYTAPSGNNTYTTSGVYQDTIMNTTGCDSIITINLTINNSESDTFDIEACKNYSVPGEDTTFYSSGTYIDSLITSTGCDSIVTYNISIITVDTSVNIISQTSLQAIMSGPNVSYQWLDCNNNSLLNGDTNSFFEATHNGDYAVIVINKNCSDTSSCYSISSVGFERQFDKQEVKIYPNPTSDKIQVEINGNKNFHFYQLFDFSGKLIQNGKMSNGVNMLSLRDFSNGVYFFKLNHQSFRLIKN